MAPTHYDVLGVDVTATPEEVRTAYRLAARDHHPDAGGDAGRMQEVNAAWHVLGDPARRAAYDRDLGRPAPEPSNGGDEPYDPFEPDEPLGVRLDPDLYDTRPLGQTRALTGWWALMPPATVLAAIAAFFAAFVFRAPGLLAVSGGLGILALGLFVLAPLRAMSRKR